MIGDGAEGSTLSTTQNAHAGGAIYGGAAFKIGGTKMAEGRRDGAGDVPAEGLFGLWIWVAVYGFTRGAPVSMYIMDKRLWCRPCG